MSNSKINPNVVEKFISEAILEIEKAPEQTNVTQAVATGDNESAQKHLKTKGQHPNRTKQKKNENR